MNYKKIYDEWINNDYFDKETKDELLQIKDEDEIKERFYKDLEFGTGGLRGIIGAGTNRINKYTVRRASTGLGNYILKKGNQDVKQRGVVIAYDCRYKSKEFCIESAKALNALGIKTYIFDDLRSTPQLSFAVRYLNAIAGIVITASHNPPEYNGYKVYWEDGAQISLDIANEIINEINKITDYTTLNIEDENTRTTLLNEQIDDEYINAVKSMSISKKLNTEQIKDFKIVYTPLHGTGAMPVKRILNEVGFENVYSVAEQDIKDPSFSTVKSPNPEEKEAFTMALNVAKQNDADIIIATDPDCDRVGICVKHKDEYITLTGNEVGAILVDFILLYLKEENILPKNGAIVKTIVTSDIGGAIAKSFGIDCIDTLTGFKFIGEKIKEFEDNKEKTFIFGYEESYGYLYGTHSRDKDAVVASMLIAQMGAYYKSIGMDLYEALISIYEKYGYYKSSLESLTLKGIDGTKKIKSIMNYFRDNDLKNIFGEDFLFKKDYINGIDNLPISNVISLSLNKGTIIIRPSGTEPKIKFYFFTNGISSKDCDEKMDDIKCKFMKLIDLII